MHKKLNLYGHPVAFAQYPRAFQTHTGIQRQLGADFNDDTVDAGELGAGHTVTALYEIAPHTSDINLPDVDPLKYQSEREASASGELLTIKLRFKWPDSDTSELVSFPVEPSDAEFADCSETFRFASAVAGYGMLLRDSPHQGDVSLDWIHQTAQGAVGEDPGGHRDQFLVLVEKTASLPALVSQADGN